MQQSPKLRKKAERDVIAAKGRGRTVTDSYDEFRVSMEASFSEVNASFSEENAEDAEAAAPLREEQVRINARCLAVTSSTAFPAVNPEARSAGAGRPRRD